MRQRLYGNIEERLLNSLEFTDFCWTWIAARSSSGYGRVSIAGQRGWVHRFVVEWAIGRTLGTDEQVDHLCRNRACARPTHLEIVTPRENTRRGSVAKLTFEDVLDIRCRRKAGEKVKNIAKVFGIHYTHVVKITNGNRWGPSHQQHSYETRRKGKAHKDLFD